MQDLLYEIYDIYDIKKYRPEIESLILKTDPDQLKEVIKRINFLLIFFFKKIIKSIPLKHSALMADLIKKYNLNIGNFQKLYSQLQNQTVIFFIKKKKKSI